jgi:hypothetical protein
MKLITTALVLFSLVMFSATTTTDPSKPFSVIVKWSNPSDTIFLRRLRADESICCDFAFLTEKVDTLTGCCSEIYSRRGTHLGSIYGIVTPGFLSKIAPKMEEARWDFEEKRANPFSLEVKVE